MDIKTMLSKELKMWQNLNVTPGDGAENEEVFEGQPSGDEDQEE